MKTWRLFELLSPPKLHKLKTAESSEHLSGGAAFMAALKWNKGDVHSAKCRVLLCICDFPPFSQTVRSFFIRAKLSLNFWLRTTNIAAQDEMAELPNFKSSYLIGWFDPLHGNMDIKSDVIHVTSPSTEEASVGTVGSAEAGTFLLWVFIHQNQKWFLSFIKLYNETYCAI